MANVIEDITKLYEQGFIEAEVKVYGHVYTMRSLTDEESVWVDAYVPISAITNMTQQLLTARRSPVLAATIRKIDGVDVKEMFKTEGDYRDALRNVLKQWPERIVAELFIKYRELEAREDESVQKIVSTAKENRVDGQ